MHGKMFIKLTGDPISHAPAFHVSADEAHVNGEEGEVGGSRGEEEGVESGPEVALYVLPGMREIASRLEVEDLKLILHNIKS